MKGDMLYAGQETSAIGGYKNSSELSLGKYYANTKKESKKLSNLFLFFGLFIHSCLHLFVCNLIV